MFTTGRARVLRWAAAIGIALSSTLLTAGVADAAPMVTLGGGSGVYVEQLDGTNSAAECTLTAVGYDRENRLVALTAGHCGEVGARIAAEYTRSGGIGVIANKDDYFDWAVIALDPDRVLPTRQVGPSVINGIGAGPRVGDIACKNGRTTGYTCGPVWETNETFFRSQVCANHGDSGGPVLLGDRLIGMVVAGQEFELGPVTIDMQPCKGAGDLLHTPEIATTISSVLADIDASGGVGAGFRPF
ncbi:peptidase S1 [Nocardia sp. 2]|uniref:Peptidase S1 n=1 Tax=Nocardia acididurans TaxID=2802282 RepID=A0ABS1LZH5_9NOCA|nr:S1 family peptidase [Nocardia acididurans]MBL1073345.1 peptidase S1 [Nocardia acididurans]